MRQRCNTRRRVKSCGSVSGRHWLKHRFSCYLSCDSLFIVVAALCSGKSTLIGVLSSSGLDDGRGAARSLVLRHRHEQENGRTSAVTMEIMGYSKDGQQVRSLLYSLVLQRNCMRRRQR